MVERKSENEKKKEDERKEPCIRIFLRGMSDLSKYTDILPRNLHTYISSYILTELAPDIATYVHTYIHIYL